MCKSYIGKPIGTRAVPQLVVVRIGRRYKAHTSMLVFVPPRCFCRNLTFGAGTVSYWHVTHLNDVCCCWHSCLLLLAAAGAACPRSAECLVLTSDNNRS